MRNSIIYILILLLSGSCSYRNRNVLFKTDKPIEEKSAVVIYNGTKTDGAIYRHRIKPGDRLVLRFLNNYDIGSSASQSATSGANSGGNGESGYLVNYDSTVIMPLVGRLNLVGLTRLEAASRLEKEYSKFIVNPIIDLNIATLSVTILGEVNSQGKIQIDKENTTLVEVIARAGGIKETGKKHGIKIIRGNEIIVVNLKTIESLNSPAIVMHDNDIIYVEPYALKANSEPAITIQPMLGLVTTLLQTALFITNVLLIYSSK